MKDKEKKKRKKQKMMKQLLVISLMVFVFFTAFYFYRWYSYRNVEIIPSVQKLIEEKKENNFSDKDSQKLDTSNYVNKIPEYRRAYGNQNIMGYLQIPGVNVSTLVARANDNEFYLRNNFYNQSDVLGAVFFDYRNSNLNKDRQINIYGHNSEQSELFSQLPLVNISAYLNKEMFQNYKDVYLSIDERQLHYNVVAVKVITASDPEHMKLVYSGDDDYLSHVRKVFSNTLYKEDNLRILASDRLLVLQICNYNPKNTYLLVICKLV